MSNKVVVMILSCVIVFSSCGGHGDQKETVENKSSTTAVKEVENTDAPLITFVELGSVNCIPCVKMQPVMKNIEAKYEQQVEVIFYDVWQEDQKAKAREYGIRLIPTQVFLDVSGKEIFRHEGFFPEEEIDQLLRSHGLVPKSEG